MSFLLLQYCLIPSYKLTPPSSIPILSISAYNATHAVTHLPIPHKKVNTKIMTIHKRDLSIFIFIYMHAAIIPFHSIPSSIDRSVDCSLKSRRNQSMIGSLFFLSRFRGSSPICMHMCVMDRYVCIQRGAERKREVRYEGTVQVVGV